MNRTMKLTACAVALISLLTAQQAWPQPANSPWPMFMHDARHTGRSPYIGPSQPNLAWSRQGSGSNPIIGPKGLIYVSCYPEPIALRLDGTVAFFGDLARVTVATLDNTIYFRPDSALYALNADGTLKWKLNVGGGGMGGNIVLDAQGDIFLDDGYNLSSIDPGGILFWQKPLKASEGGSAPIRPICDPAIGQDGTVILLIFKD